MQHGALVLEGGSLRCLFTAGVLDILMDAQVWFEYVNGVSAGSLSGYNYISRQPGRTRDVNETFCGDKRYLGFRNMLRNGGVFNFNFLFGEICDTLMPLDRAAFAASPQRFEVVATDCLTGKAAFFEKGTISQEEFDLACRASSSMPGLSDIIRIRDVPYLDGGCACPIAFQRALDLGYEKVVVVLTRPALFRKQPDLSPAMLRGFSRIYRRYPAFCNTLAQMNRTYNAQCAQLEQLEREGKVFLIRPDGPVLVGRLERDSTKLEALYQSGRRIMLEQMEPMMRYLMA